MHGREKDLETNFCQLQAQSDALLHVVDASGGIDSTGQISEIGTGDPISDFADIEEELVIVVSENFRRKP